MNFQALRLTYKLTTALTLCAFCSVVVGGPTLQFAGRSWEIKDSPSTPIGPGPNLFSADPADVWSDSNGLHLSIHEYADDWFSTEVRLAESLGYGTYMYQTESRLDLLDANAVLGAFTFDLSGGSPIPGDPYREIDFEDSRWGNPADPMNAQMVVQPYTVAGNIERYTLPDLSTDSKLTRFFTWSPGKVEFFAVRGHHTPTSYGPQDVIHQFSYQHDGTTRFVPTPGQEQFHLNLWLTDSSGPLDDQPIEILVNDFQYFSLGPEYDTGTVLFDFQTGDQGWGSFGSITTTSGELPVGGSVGQGRYHVGDYSLPDAGNFGIVDVSQPSQDLSAFDGLSVDALFRDVSGQSPFVGAKELDIIVATGLGPTEEEFFAPKQTMSNTFQTFSVMFDEFQSSIDSLPPTPADLSDVTIKLVVLNSNGTGVAELVYDQVTGIFAAVEGDYNGDLVVDSADFTIWRDTLGSTTDLRADGNGNGTVDSDDYQYWADRYSGTGDSSTQSSSTVPEPNALLLFVIALGAPLLERFVISNSSESVT